MDLADLDAVLVSGFLDHLEDDRGSSVASRNTRLAAVHSFFRFASYQHPEHAETIQQVLAIPRKKTQSIPQSFLTSTEMDAVVSAADLSTWCGRRDHVLLVVALRTGLRLSELTGLRCRDVQTGTAAHVNLGKGRKRRDTPLDKSTVVLVCAWLSERRGGPDDALFPSRLGGRLSPDAGAPARVSLRRARQRPTVERRSRTWCPHPRHRSAVRGRRPWRNPPRRR